MELDDESMERVPFLGDTGSVTANDQSIFQGQRGKKLFGLFISLAVGCYAGIICRTMQETWIYSALFCGEALICAFLGGVVRPYTLSASVTSLASYFLISAVTTPIATLIGLRLDLN